MLIEDADLPVAALAPAPWTLSGRGTILLVKLPKPALDDPAFVPAELRGLRRHGGFALVMFVDYEDSAVGPYRELLYIPGRFDFPNGRHYSITRIYVSSMESVVNGRRNWGIPKDCCDFDYRYGADGRDVFEVSHEGRRFAHLALQARGPGLPFTTALLPDALLTLSQIHGGRQFTYVPSASGRVQFARVTDWAFDGALFPDLARGRVLACVRTPRFRMGFPVAAVHAAPVAAG
ncbi:MAG: hypothetical protein NVS9B10_06370 [Nevskia sp.]